MRITRRYYGDPVVYARAAKMPLRPMPEAMADLRDLPREEFAAKVRELQAAEREARIQAHAERIQRECKSVSQTNGSYSGGRSSQKRTT